MKRAIALACALGALVWAPAAFAGTPFTIGSGTDPHLLVDPASGAAHVVWRQDATVRYCRVPRGATACGGPIQNLGAPPGGGADTPYLVREPDGTLYVTQHRYVIDDAHLKASTNGGDTWSDAWRRLYSGKTWESQSQPILLGDGRIAFPSWNSGVRAYAANSSGTQADEDAIADIAQPEGHTFRFELGRPAGGGLVATADTNEHLYFWRLSGADINSGASWTGPTLVGEGTDSTLASGPSGAYVVSTAGGRTEVRRANGDGLGAPSVVENTGGPLADITVGGSGVGVVYRRADAPYRLRFSLSTDGGATFTAPYNIAPDDGESYSGLEVGLANDNQGFATWQGGVDNVNEIRLTSLEPYTDPPLSSQPPPPAPPPNRGGNQPPGPSRPATRTTTTRVPGGELRLGTPNRCVRRGGRFTVTLKLKKEKVKRKKSGKGRLKVKLRRVDFYIGSKRVTIDRKAPYRKTLRVPIRSRAKVNVRARAFIKVKRGKSPTKSRQAKVGANVDVC